MAQASSRNPKEKWAWIESAAAVTDDVCTDWPWACLETGYGVFAGTAGKDRHVHAAVCALVHGPRPEGMQAAHSCGRSICCSGSHLRWATPKENHADKVSHGTHLAGRRCPWAKLGEPEVKAIRAQYAAGSVTQARLAVQFGVCRGTISDIVTRKSWRSLD